MLWVVSLHFAYKHFYIMFLQLILKQHFLESVTWYVVDNIEISKTVTTDLNEFVLQMLNTAAVLPSGLWGERGTQGSERAGHLEASCVHELILSLLFRHQKSLKAVACGVRKKVRMLILLFLSNMTFAN